MDRETERLGDIAEALLWGADDELRKFIRKSAGDVKAVIERGHRSAQLST